MGVMVGLWVTVRVIVGAVVVGVVVVVEVIVGVVVGVEGGVVAVDVVALAAEALASNTGKSDHRVRWLPLRRVLSKTVSLQISPKSGATMLPQTA